MGLVMEFAGRSRFNQSYSCRIGCRDELDRYDEQTEEVQLPSGEKARVTIFAFWDMDEWESDMRSV